MTPHMLREIRETPAALEATVAREARVLIAAARELRRARFIVMCARGTSDHAAIYARYLFEYFLRKPVALAAPSLVTLYRRPADLAGGAVVALSQSGAGTDVVEFVRQARKHGANTIGITNEPGSPLAREAQCAVVTRCGREKSVAATKTYAAQLYVLLGMALAAAGEEARWRDYLRLPGQLAGLLRREDELRELAAPFRFIGNCVTLSRGFTYSTALEFALKLKETCYLLALPFSTADFLHGPIALIEAHFPAFFIAPRGPAMRLQRQTLARVLASGAHAFGLSDDPAFVRRCQHGFLVQPQFPEIFAPIPFILPLQLFACFLSLARGLNPDQPRGLLKVTKTR